MPFNNYVISIPGLGQEAYGAQMYTELWAYWSITGGVLVLVLTLGGFINSKWFKTLFQIILLPILLIIVLIQLPALFFWLYVGFAHLSWSNAIGFVMHLFLLLVSFCSGLIALDQVVDKYRSSH